MITSSTWKRSVQMEAKAVGLNWEQGEGGSEVQSLVAVCGGCPMLQIGVTGNVH
jgi:hypothetical protein